MKKGSLLGASLIVAGTAIGGGMLGLPVLTALGGFWPATVMYFICGLFMASTGILFLEIYLWDKRETNIVSMAQMTLGLPGKILAWVLYLFLFYSLNVAYIAGGGNLVKDFFIDVLHVSLPTWAAPFIFILIFVPFITFGAKPVDRLNRILMSGLILSFITFIVLGCCHVKLENLIHGNMKLALMATPVIFISFGFQATVPTLANYLGRDKKRTAKAIWSGTAIAFIIYLIWEWLILGVVPLQSLSDTLKCGETSIHPLKDILQNPWLYVVGQFFAFFALVTSFLGVGLGLIDFLSDGLKIEKDGRGKSFLIPLIYIPPLILVFINPCIFLDALRYAGGFGSALLLGLLPILMTWRGRYRLNLESKSFFPGGKSLLFFMILFVIFEMAVMIITF